MTWEDGEGVVCDWSAVYVRRFGKMSREKWYGSACCWMRLCKSIGQRGCRSYKWVYGKVGQWDWLQNKLLCGRVVQRLSAGKG